VPPLPQSCSRTRCAFACLFSSAAPCSMTIAEVQEAGGGSLMEHIPGCGNCWGGVLSLLATERKPNQQKREEFEQVVSFLASVPHFRTRLPRAELPKVARLLQRREWAPGQSLIRQGDTGRAFFLIQSGEAAVITGAERVRAVLQAGDYFGGHTLTSEQRNIATIVAQGPAPLVTLSMSRSAFQKSGLQGLMQFPKRPAIYDAQSQGPEPLTVTAPIPEERAFICEAIRRNENLRALVEADSTRLQSIAMVAERRVVPKGTVLVKAGDLCQEFFIVRQGSFFATLQERPDSGVQLSAEAAVSRSKMAERVLRKQDFLKKMSTPRACQCVSETRSFCWIPSEVINQSGKRWSWSSKGSADPGKKAQTTSPELPRRKGFARRTDGRRMNEQPRQREAQFIRRCSDGDSRETLDSLGDSETFKFHEGESFGELSLLYNSRWWASFTAEQDSVVYVIGRQHFKNGFGRASQWRIREYCDLLEEVHALTPLVSSERWELACRAGGFVEFRPGERVMHERKVREARRWYIIFSGSAIMSQERMDATTGETESVVLGVLGRAIHFGERSMLRGDAASELSVDAGPDGMTCLTFDFEVTRVFLDRIFRSAGDKFCPSVFCDVDTWCKAKAQGWRSMPNSAAMEYSREKGVCKAIQLKDLKRVSSLGSGAYGDVFLVHSPVNSKNYALKVVSKYMVQQNKAQRHISWERELLLMVDSPFIMKLHRTFRDTQHVYFLLEVALGGNLLELLHCRPEVFSEDTPRGSTAAFYSACLIAALEHLHERNIVHRDLKPENALLDDRGYAKLGDLGFARFVLGKTNTLVGTPDYMAPEIIDFPHTHDSSVDWWALGVVHFELLTGQHPWEDAGLCDQMARLMAIRRSQERDRVEFPFGFPSVAQSFVRGLLLKLPSRLGAHGGAEEVRRHQMFADLNFDFNAFHAHQMASPALQEQACEYDNSSSTASILDELESENPPLPGAGKDGDWDEKF